MDTEEEEISMAFSILSHSVFKALLFDNDLHRESMV